VTNLPGPGAQTRFFGRRRELDRLSSLRAGVVTLWGPPGIGKTRLAVEACTSGALSLAGAPENAWFCDLAAARDVGGLCDAVVGAIGLSARGTPATPTSLAGALAARDAGVLVLDGGEHVPKLAETIEAWAAAAPQLLFLVTTRARLKIAGETALEVPSLEEAGALFLECARAATSGGAGRPEIDEDDVARLVARLDGIPLAVELAAARLEILGIGELTRRLARPLETLGGEPGTLRRAIESSVRLLPPVVQRALARCAVFRGGFSLAAAEAVLDDVPRSDVLEHLGALRDASLLRFGLEPGEGGTRFVLLGAVREYARDALDASGDSNDARRRHARHFLAAERTHARRDDAGDVEDAIAFELGERTALDSGRVLGLLEAASRIRSSAPSESFAMLLARTIALGLERDLPPAALARGELALGRALHLRGRLGEARDALAQAERLGAGEPPLAAEIAIDTGLVHHQLRELDAARACYERALEVHGDSGSALARARCIANLGAVHHDARRYDAALEHYQRALAVLRGAPDPRLEGIFLVNLGVLHHERGASARARASFELGLERLEATSDRRFEAIARTNLGMLLHETGALEAAQAAHERALVLLRGVVDPRSEALCLGRLAMAHAALGEHERAQRASQRAQRILVGLDDPVAVAILAVFRAFVELCGGAEDAVIRERLAEARAPSWTADASLVDVSDDARAAARLIEAAFARRRPPCDDVLVVGPDAAWFRPPDGASHDLGDRRVLKRLLWRLVVQHREAPGEGLTLEALRAAGWPDERVRQAAAVNRIHVALTDLRRRGLRACLVRRGANYLIDPAIRVEVSEVGVA
jgi:predicted ATPase